MKTIHKKFSMTLKYLKVITLLVKHKIIDITIMVQKIIPDFGDYFNSHSTIENE